MSLDFAQAIKSPLNGDGWIVKLIIGGLLMCIPIANFIVFGYLVVYLKNVLNGNEKLPPFSDIGSNFVLGWKFFVGTLILCVPLFLIILIISMSGMPKIGVTTISNLVQIIYTVLFLIMTLNFAIDGKILSMIGFQRAMLFAKDNSTGLVSLFVYFLALQIVSIIIVVLFCITIVGILLLPALLFALTIMTYNLIGQYGKSSANLERIKAEAAQL